MECESCGRTGPDGASFCPHCGHRYPQNLTCPGCGHESPLETRFCFNCGASLEEGSANPEAPAAGSIVGQAERPRWEPAGCPRCGTAIEPGSTFCFRCGLPLDREPSTRVRHAPELRAFVDADPAGFWIRVIAFLIDIGVVLLITYLAFRNPGSGFEYLVGAIYFTVLVGAWATTGGKRIFGLFVVRPDGSKVGPGRALARYVSYYASAILLIGFIAVAFRQDKRGIHDLICDTVVIKRFS